MARRKARRAANSNEQRTERTWTGHRPTWVRPCVSAEKMPLRLSDRTGDPSPFGGSNKPFLGSDDAPAENSARRSRATWSNSSSSSTSPSPQLSPWVKEENPGREKGTGVPRRRRTATEHLPLSRNDMAGKPARPEEIQRLPPAPPRARSSQSAAWPPHGLHHPVPKRRGARNGREGAVRPWDRLGATGLEHDPGAIGGKGNRGASGKASRGRR